MCHTAYHAHGGTKGSSKVCCAGHRIAPETSPLAIFMSVLASATMTSSGVPAASCATDASMPSET